VDSFTAKFKAVVEKSSLQIGEVVAGKSFSLQLEAVVGKAFVTQIF
jgi:hypothetical protein